MKRLGQTKTSCSNYGHIYKIVITSSLLTSCALKQIMSKYYNNEETEFDATRRLFLHKVAVANVTACTVGMQKLN